MTYITDLLTRRRLRGHMFMTKEDEKNLPNMDNAPDERSRVPVKFFSSSMTWYVLQYESSDEYPGEVYDLRDDEVVPGTFYALVVNEATGEQEFGNVTRHELETLWHPHLGIMAVERDRFWDARTTLGELQETLNSRYNS